MTRIKKTGEIHIHAPRIESINGKARLIATIDYKGETRDVWFEVEEKYGQYLCWERSDAFLIGLLNFAMREGCDIICDTPVTTRLLFQIETYLIPLLIMGSKFLYHTKIKATVEDTLLPNAGAVGTGVSCGVDSLHAIYNYKNPKYEQYKLTHLTLHNVGSFWKTENNQYSWHVNHAKAFAKEYGFELIITDSNFAKAFPQNHFLAVVYSSGFAIYAMQKLWKTYFFASAGNELKDIFNLHNTEILSSEDYDMIAFDTFSTQSLRIYVEGAATVRMEKLKIISTWEATRKYLHVCTSDVGGNCGYCTKCLRTLVSLDALGILDEFSTVFDIATYKKNRHARLFWLYEQYISPHGDSMSKPAYQILKHDISVFNKIVFWTRIQIKWLRCRLSRIKPLYMIVHPIFDYLRKLKRKSNDRK